MPIITKKDKLSISMTWASSDDKSEVDIYIQRDGDDDVTITLQSGKSAVVIGSSCVKELYDFLIDRGILAAPVATMPSSPSFSVPPLMPGPATCGGQESSDDIVGLLSEAKRWSEVDSATRRHLSHSSSPAGMTDSVYASPSMVAATGSAVIVQGAGAANVNTIIRSNPTGVSLPNESSEPDGGEEVIEMEDIPSDIFGR